MARPRGPKRKPPPGVVVVACGDLGRYTNFAASMSRMVAFLDPESAVMWSVGSSVADNCNNGAAALVEQEGMDWMWLLGDDHEFDEALLTSMLDTMYTHDLDVLVPLCFRRSWPPAFVIYDRREGGVLKTVTPETVAEILRSGEHIREVEAAGTGGMLIRKRVLEGIEPPCFRNVLEGPDGKIISQAGEDLNFCHLARKATYHIHAHYGLVLGHIRAVTLVPEMRDDYFGMTVFFGVQHGPFLPLVRPAE